MVGIPISPKYGVNPSCTVCFFCGETSGIALFGRMKGDVEAPPYALVDYEPCNNCREKFKQGSLLLEVDTRPHIDGQPPIQQQENQKLYPTGRFKVLKKEACERIFGKAHEKALLDVETYNMLFSEIDKELEKKEFDEKNKPFENEEQAYNTIMDSEEEIIITERSDEDAEVQND